MISAWVLAVRFSCSPALHLSKSLLDFHSCLAVTVVELFFCWRCGPVPGIDWSKEIGSARICRITKKNTMGHATKKSQISFLKGGVNIVSCVCGFVNIFTICKQVWDR